MEEKGISSNRNKTKTLKLAVVMAGLSVLLVSIAFTVLAVTPVAAQSVPVEVRVNAPEEVEEGETFVVTIDIKDVTDFTSGKFDLSFDSSVVDADDTDVTEGNIDGVTIPILMSKVVDSGTIRVTHLMLPIGTAVSGSGYLAKIEFEVKGEGGAECMLNISNGQLVKIVKGDKWDTKEEIPVNWIDAEIRIGGEEEEEEEVGEEVTPGSPNITAWKPAEAVVGNAVGESRTFNLTVNQIADISWQINGTEVQTNESTREAVYTNKSAAIGTWNVSAIATNTTTGLSDIHTWIWSVTLIATVTPTPTLAPGETPKPTPTPTLAPGETPKPTPTPTLAPGETPKPTKPTPTPKPPGFEVMFAVVGMLAIAYILLKKKFRR